MILGGVRSIGRLSSIADTRCLQSEINNVLQWSERNKLPLNLVKCEVITVQRKEEVRDLGIPVDLYFDRTSNKVRQRQGR